MCNCHVFVRTLARAGRPCQHMKEYTGCTPVALAEAAVQASSKLSMFCSECSERSECSEARPPEAFVPLDSLRKLRRHMAPPSLKESQRQHAPACAMRMCLLLLVGC